MEKLIKSSVNYLVKPILRFYLQFKSNYSYGGLKFVIFPGVFHPRFFFSSKFLAEFVLSLSIKGKSLCELCTGSGFIAILALKQGARVLCTDIDPNAIMNTLKNFKINEHYIKSKDLTVLRSDVFGDVPVHAFDIIVINPPYFFKPITSDNHLAWNCGENGEFFTKFFSNLRNYVHSNSAVYIVLAENCEIERIKSIALSSNFVLKLVKEKKILWEKNFIFQIEQQDESAN